MSEIEKMRDIIKQNGGFTYSSQRGAEALYEAGFRKVDTDRLDELERRIVRLEGYTALPEYFGIPVAVPAKR